MAIIIDFYAVLGARANRPNIISKKDWCKKTSPPSHKSTKLTRSSPQIFERRSPQANSHISLTSQCPRKYRCSQGGSFCDKRFFNNWHGCTEPDERKKFTNFEVLQYAVCQICSKQRLQPLRVHIHQRAVVGVAVQIQSALQPDGIRLQVSAGVGAVIPLEVVVGAGFFVKVLPGEAQVDCCR